MSSTYNPTEETINSILTGLLPVLIVGLFNGFEDSKRKTLSVINIFDDFVIFASIVVYPLITAIEWYQYYSSDYKKRVIATYTSIAIKLIIFYTLFLWFQYKNEVKENENNKNEGNGKNEGGNKENDETSKNEGRGNFKMSIKKLFKKAIKYIKIFLKGEMLACYFIIVLTILSYTGYDAFIHGDLNNNANKVYSHMSNYCVKNFGVNKCNSLRLANRIIYIYGIVVNTLHAVDIIFLRKYHKGTLRHYVKKYKNTVNCFITISNFFKHINIILLIVYPAIVSGYLISTNSITTKIAFGICTLSFTRLVNHFNENPDKINTLISIYLNTSEIKSKDKKKQIKILTEEIEKLTKEIREQAEQKEI